MVDVVNHGCVLKSQGESFHFSSCVSVMATKMLCVDSVVAVGVYDKHCLYLFCNSLAF